MNSTEKENVEDHDADDAHIVPIEPPAKHTGSVKEPVKLVFEVAFLIIMFVPIVIWSLFEYFSGQRKSVTGKVVLITGSGRGLGRGFVEEFARLGCKVACVDIDPNLNKETLMEVHKKYPGCNAKAYTCNVIFSNEIKDLKAAVIRDFGRVDILVNNAGIIGGSSIIDFDDMFLHGVINVNLTSHFLTIREFLPDMIKRNEGHVVAVASMGSFGAISKASMYVASKHGVLGLMDCLHCELEENPNNAVKTSVICPYFVNTSALYVKHWKLRLPEFSIEEVVKTSVDGILRNRRVIAIPSIFYFFVFFLKFLPDKMVSLVRKVFYVEVNMPPKEDQMKTPLYHYLMKSAKKFELSIRNGSVS